MLTGEVKKRLTEVLTDIVERHRRARAAVTDEVIIIGLSFNFVCAFPDAFILSNQLYTG